MDIPLKYGLGQMTAEIPPSSQILILFQLTFDDLTWMSYFYLHMQREIEILN